MGQVSEQEPQIRRDSSSNVHKHIILLNFHIKLINSSDNC